MNASELNTIIKYQSPDTSSKPIRIKVEYKDGHYELFNIDYVENFSDCLTLVSDQN